MKFWSVYLCFCYITTVAVCDNPHVLNKAAFAKGSMKNSNKSCVTPNGEIAQCIPLNHCKVFLETPKNSVNTEVLRFMRRSLCSYYSLGYKDIPYVCCGSILGFQKTITATEIPTVTSPTQIVEDTVVTTIPPVSENMCQMDTSTVAQELKIVDYSNHPNFKLLPSRNRCGRQISSSTKIVGGNETDIDEFPWLALLIYKFQEKTAYNCGGSLINPRYVLTAAHCIRPALVSVRLGEYNLNTDPDVIVTLNGDEDISYPFQEYGLEQGIKHTTYSIKDKNKFNDIGLIRLKQNVEYNDFVKPICLPIYGERSNSEERLFIAGWGVTESGMAATIKMKLEVPAWSDEACASVYSIGFHKKVLKGQMCAGGEIGRDSCVGDSGGPLMRTFPGKTHFYIEGVVSYGPNPCGSVGIPAVYVRVSEYIDWILDSMQPY